MPTSKGIVYFGFGNEDGSWRIMRDSDSNDLLVQLRVDGEWVTQYRFTPQPEEPPPPAAITKTLNDDLVTGWNDAVAMIPWHLTVSASETLNAWADAHTDTGNPSNYTSQYDSNAANWADGIVTIPTPRFITASDNNASKWLDALTHNFLQKVIAEYMNSYLSDATRRIGFGSMPSDTNESNWNDAVAEEHPAV